MSFRRNLGDHMAPATDKDGGTPDGAEHDFATPTSLWSVAGSAALVAGLLALALAVGTYIGMRSAQDNRSVETASWPSRAPETSARADDDRSGERSSDEAASRDATTTTSTTVDESGLDSAEEAPATTLPDDEDRGTGVPPEEPRGTGAGGPEMSFDDSSLVWPTSDSWESWDTWEDWWQTYASGSSVDAADDEDEEEDCRWRSRRRHRCDN